MPQDILVFDGHYMHCGQPMQKLGSGVRQLSTPVFTDRPFEDEFEVYLTTRVLHCFCGFQIEVPE